MAATEYYGETGAFRIIRKAGIFITSIATYTLYQSYTADVTTIVEPFLDSVLPALILAFAGEPLLTRIEKRLPIKPGIRPRPFSPWGIEDSEYAERVPDWPADGGSGDSDSENNRDTDEIGG